MMYDVSAPQTQPANDLEIEQRTQAGKFADEVADILLIFSGNGHTKALQRAIAC